MVFYYSRGNKTKLFAEALGEVLGQEVFELKSDLNDLSNFKFFVKSLMLTFSGKSYPITNMPKEFPKEVYLCTPIWGGQISAPARYFAENTTAENVNLLLTASVPVEKYKTNAAELLKKLHLRVERTMIFATSGKIPIELETIKEQMREIM
ncbi:MAG: hypothetical protein FWF78_00975 [Defluviitaleaceae bacterium]|nr:hypothetical protein [Defluviitaleaceae bacterium]